MHRTSNHGFHIINLDIYINSSVCTICIKYNMCITSPLGSERSTKMVTTQWLQGAGAGATQEHNLNCIFVAIAGR